MNIDVKNNEKNNDTRPRFGLKEKWTAKLTIASLAAFGFIAPMMVQPKKAEAYDMGTHRFLASQGIFMIKKDKGESVVTKLYEKVNDNGDTGARILMDYSIMPDFDESSSGHFYDPGTGANYLGNKNDNANVRFCNHYNNAVSHYKNGDKELAYEELGRALHYLGDMSEPHHAADILGLQHNLYEGWVELKRLQYAKDSAPKDVYKFALDNNVWVIGHDAANKAKAYAKYVNTLRNEMNDGNRQITASNTLPYAQYITAAVIDKFLVDIGEVSKP